METERFESECPHDGWVATTTWTTAAPDMLQQEKSNTKIQCRERELAVSMAKMGTDSLFR